MTTDPVPGQYPSRSLDTAPRYRLAAFLGRCARVPRARFYNRRSRYEHPRKHPFRRLPAERRGKNPPTFDIETALQRPALAFGFGAAPDHLAVIRPPTACALDGAYAGFRSFDSLIPVVTPDFTVLSHTEGEEPRLFRPEAPLSNRTLWHLSSPTGKRTTKVDPSPDR
jgi:hypothetical protein